MNTPELLGQMSTKKMWAILSLPVFFGIFGAIVSPQSAVAILGFAGLMWVSIFNLFSNRQTAEYAARAAEKTAEVAQTLHDTDAKLDTKLEKIHRVNHKTHILVNSNMRVVLEDNAKTKRRIATLTGDNGDIASAEQAEYALEEHKRQQAIVDAGEE